MKETTMQRMDLEWMELMKLAKRIGLSVEEVREFLRREINARNA